MTNIGDKVQKGTLLQAAHGLNVNSSKFSKEMPMNSPKNSAVRDLNFPEKMIGQQSDSATDAKSLTTINVNMPFSRSSKTVV